WNGRLRLRGTLDGNAFSLTYIAIIPASVANAVFLVVLFLLEDAFASLRGVPALGVALLGFAATAGALVLLCFIYNAFPFKLRVTLGTVTRINQVTPFRVALFAGLFEAFILPLMTFLFAAFTFHPLLAFTLNGIISGFVGGLVGSFIFNLLAPYVKPGLR
ncbi:MAG TPA: hypothetical protein VLJ21_02335, partial [Candidatus Binatia bacterium]|nr:hypothetical protein [Candidatus Binatia bacterium]